MDEMEKRKTYCYGPKRDSLELVMECVIWTVMFYILRFIIEKYSNVPAEMSTGIKGINGISSVAWCIFLVVYVVGARISIFCKTKQELKITDAEVHYLYGVLSKQKVSIPISKVRSCRIGTSPLQRAFGLSTLSICTAGDNDKITFEDIKGGEEAYRIIMDMLR